MNIEKNIEFYNSYGEELIVWHGTNRENLDSILLDGLSLIMNCKHGKLYGNGIYFTKKIKKAIYYADAHKKTSHSKYIIVSIMRKNKIIRGNMNMDLLPLYKNQNNIYQRYDTAVDDVHNPIEFIKKSNNEFCIIGYLEIYIQNRDCELLQPLQSPGKKIVFINNSNINIYLYWISPSNSDIIKIDNDGVKYIKKINKSKMTFLGNLTIQQQKTITNVLVGHKFINGIWVQNYTKFTIYNIYITSKKTKTILLTK